MASPAAAITLTDLPHDMLREIAARLPRPSIGALALSSKAVRDALVERPSRLWRAVTCTASFLASTDPAAAMLCSRAAEVKNMGLRAATARAAPALRLFTSLESIVMGLLSVKDGERLLNAAAAACPRLTTATLSFPKDRPGRINLISPDDNLTINAPQLTCLVLVGPSQLEAVHVRLMFSEWNTPALETLEFKGFIPEIDMDSDVKSNLVPRIEMEPEVVAARRVQAAAIASGVGAEAASLNALNVYFSAAERLMEKRAQEFLDEGKSVVHAPPRLRKVVMRVIASAQVLPLLRFQQAALEADGVEVVHLGNG